MKSLCHLLSGKIGRRVVMGCVCGGLTVAAVGTSHGQTWDLKWSDEFNAHAGTLPDPAAWAYDTGGGGFGNHEVETYCAPSFKDPACDASQPNAFQDGKGNLVLHAAQKNGTWTSGRIKTAGLKEFQYGRIEARMKLVVANGFWPAFWMLGSNMGKVGWPAAGEQDIMEWVQSYGPNTTSSTVHGPGYSGGQGIGSKFLFSNSERVDDDSFHTYGVLWTEDRMQFYRDNAAQPFFTLTPANLPSGTQWVYNQPFFILLNFAIGGGGFGGFTDTTTPTSGEVLVDYVRVYQAGYAPKPNQSYTVVNKQSGLCLADTSPSNAQGRSLAQHRCQGGDAVEQWQFTPAADGFYTIKRRGTTSVFEAALNKKGVGTGMPIQLRETKDRPTQLWKLVANADKTYSFAAHDHGLCLEAPAAGPAGEGQPIVQASCNASPAQDFILTQQP